MMDASGVIIARHKVLARKAGRIKRPPISNAKLMIKVVINLWGRLVLLANGTQHSIAVCAQQQRCVAKRTSGTFVGNIWPRSDRRSDERTDSGSERHGSSAPEGHAQGPAPDGRAAGAGAEAAEQRQKQQ